MTRDEKIIEVVGAVSSLTPLMGGPLSSILMGISEDRRFERVRKVIIELAERLGDVEADREAFVRSEDFEDLLIETLQRVAAERDEGKRLVYRNILLNAIRCQAVLRRDAAVPRRAQGTAARPVVARRARTIDAGCELSFVDYPGEAGRWRRV